MIFRISHPVDGAIICFGDTSFSRLVMEALEIKGAMMKLRYFLMLFALVLLSACAPIVFTTVTPVPQRSQLPDLVISQVYLAMQGFPGGLTTCVPFYGPLEIRALIQNQGQATAYNVSVVETSTGSSLQIAELVAGQSMELSFPAAAPSGMYNVGVDMQNAIPESNENNNLYAFLSPTPTPPALCTSPVGSSLDTPIPGTPLSALELSDTALINARYHSPDWGDFQLRDGVYYRIPLTSQESQEIYSTRIQEPIFYGDVNLDGQQDALVVLNTQNGGVGHAIELAVMINQNGGADNAATISLGDRVVVESIHVENGLIMLTMLVQGPNDGGCCPSQRETWTLALVRNELHRLQR